MYAIEVDSVFSAAHALRLGGGAVEPLHGHDFRVTVRIEAVTLDGLETVIDFHIVQKLLDTIIGPWRNTTLNDIDPFRAAVNPSAERIAEEVGRRMAMAIVVETQGRERGVRVAEVRVTEAAGCLAVWRPNS